MPHFLRACWCANQHPHGTSSGCFMRDASTQTMIMIIALCSCTVRKTWPVILAAHSADKKKLPSCLLEVMAMHPHVCVRRVQTGIGPVWCDVVNGDILNFALNVCQHVFEEPAPCSSFAG
ncbi:uncharacterized protein MELLADRAFT_112444 [Melampsora larici-populina 98AG31]|uniref:Uncharacterized protein n=1 Tax=Melampsora larici-populina (strain 98AG31 / pathotype 3-4-7) TaxID=747676 RepID=F4S6H9_MELLP|nr:uncharacterized protein MELLADRAFT_112444 [Melampsora larici-populina 98AG31]EGF99756.1 hypothetical protein MELLADRAFT_112444 [Melampsora larici-populina 98AG31]